MRRSIRLIPLRLSSPGPIHSLFTLQHSFHPCKEDHPVHSVRRTIGNYRAPIETILLQMLFIPSKVTPRTIRIGQSNGQLSAEYLVNNSALFREAFPAPQGPGKASSGTSLLTAYFPHLLSVMAFAVLCGTSRYFISAERSSPRLEGGRGPLPSNAGCITAAGRANPNNSNVAEIAMGGYRGGIIGRLEKSFRLSSPHPQMSVQVTSMSSPVTSSHLDVTPLRQQNLLDNFSLKEGFLTIPRP